MEWTPCKFTVSIFSLRNQVKRRGPWVRHCNGHLLSALMGSSRNRPARSLWFLRSSGEFCSVQDSILQLSPLLFISHNCYILWFGYFVHKCTLNHYFALTVSAIRRSETSASMPIMSYLLRFSPLWSSRDYLFRKCTISPIICVSEWFNMSCANISHMAHNMGHYYPVQRNFALVFGALIFPRVPIFGLHLGLFP